MVIQKRTFFLLQCCFSPLFNFVSLKLSFLEFIQCDTNAFGFIRMFTVKQGGFESGEGLKHSKRGIGDLLLIFLN